LGKRKRQKVWGFLGTQVGGAAGKADPGDRALQVLFKVGRKANSRKKKGERVASWVAWGGCWGGLKKGGGGKGAGMRELVPKEGRKVSGEKTSISMIGPEKRKKGGREER